MTEGAALELAEELRTLIHSEYLGKRFSVEDFDKWILACLKKAASIPNRAYYYHKPLKKIRQEGFPLSIFLSSGLVSATTVEPSQEEHANFDAKVLLANGNELHVEVTCVKDGLFDLVQGEHKDTFGYAGILGVSTDEMRKAIKDGVPNIGEAVDTSDTIAECIAGVQERITAKVGKSYPRDTILLVTIEDDFRESTWQAIFTGIQKSTQTTFSNIFLVSVNSKKCGQLC